MHPDELRAATPAESQGQLDMIVEMADVAAIAWTVILRDGRVAVGHGVVLPHLLPRIGEAVTVLRNEVLMQCPARGRA